jgi:alpha-beta hydrolase superfamily lysophospholipase
MLASAFTSTDGTKLRCWDAAPPVGAPAAKIILVHGLGTHSQSLHFGYLRDHLTSQGFAVYGFDLRGYGRSEGRRAYVNHWVDFREDLRLFVEVVRQDGASAPLFLLGVSLGGLIVVNYAIHHPENIHGLIAMAPALDSSGVPASRRILLRGLSKIAPQLALKPGLDSTLLTRDRKALEIFFSDPLWQTKVTLRLASETIAAMTETIRMLPALKLPLLVLHGSADAIIPPVAGRRLHQLAGSADKELRIYDGAYHILSMETNRAEIFNDISAWIAKRTQA